MWWLYAGATAATLDVGVGYPYATLTDAVAVAVSGDVIDVHDPVVTDGLWVEDLDLTLRTTVGTNWQVGYPAYSSGGHLTLEGFDLGGGYSVGLWVEGSLTLVDVVAHDLFGAVSVAGDSFVATRSTFRDSWAPVFAEVATATIEDCTFEGNLADEQVVWLDTTSSVIRRSTFVGNDGGGGAMGILTCIGDCTVEDSVFSDNLGSDAVVWAGGALVAERNRLCDNRPTLWGLAFSGTTGRIANNLFLGNDAAFGSALLTDAVEVDVSHNDILANTGGTVADPSAATATWTHNLVAWNTGGGPVVGQTTGTITPSYSVYLDNQPSDTAWAPGVGEVSGVDPELAGQGPCTWEAVARSRTSPLRDAGDPQELDPDGTPVDVGALGGAGAPAVDADGDGTDHALDCDDLDPGTHPGAPDLPADGVDQDCDGADGVLPTATDTASDTGLPETGGTATAGPPDTGTPVGKPDDDPDPIDGHTPTDGGCGCRSTPPSFALLGLGVAALVARRRTFTGRAGPGGNRRSGSGPRTPRSSC